MCSCQSFQKYFDASRHCLQLSNKLKEKERSSTGKLGHLSGIKEQAKAKYIESINLFNDTVGPTYAKVSL